MTSSTSIKNRRYFYSALKVLCATLLFVGIAAKIVSMYLNSSVNVQAAVGTQATEANLKIAFIGDSGAGPDADAVLQLIKSEGAAAVMHPGDFDYKNDPALFDSHIQKVIGTALPYFGTVGNHDKANWKNPAGGYQAVIQNRSGSFCTGDTGNMASCNFKGLQLLELGLGSNASSNDPTQVSFIQTQLAQSNAIWKVCNWHENMNAMQVGGKGDTVGWNAYEACRTGGAIISTAHEHSYHRTKTLTELKTQTVDADPNCNTPAKECVAPGKTFVFVSGLGGNSIRQQLRCLPAVYPYGCNGEWAKIYTSDQGASYGALFLIFNYNGDPYKAHGYFKNIKGQVVDEFDIVASQNGVTPGGSSPVATATTAPGVTIQPASPTSPASTQTPSTPRVGTLGTTCALKYRGDADCKADPQSHQISWDDFSIWVTEYLRGCSLANPTGCGADGDNDGNVMDANFNYPGSGYTITDNEVNLIDYVIWYLGYGNQNFPTSIPPTQTPTSTQPTLTPTSGALTSVPPTATQVPQGPTATSGPLPQPGTTKGIWIGPDEIAKLPMSGSAWSNLLSAANGSWGSANLADNNSNHDIYTLAGALVAARKNDSAMRAKTIAGLQSATKSGVARALELSRGLQTYIIAADIIGYHDPAFEAWVRKMLTINIQGHSGGSGVIGTAEYSANNWGGHARASAIAGALYLGDNALLQRMIIAHKAFIGLPAAGNKLSMGGTNWHAGSPMAGVNVRGATINGVDVSGVLPEDWRRAAEFKWPPAQTGYMWEGMQGFVVSAVLLHRANLVPFNAGDNAVVRAFEILYRAGNPPSGDDTWIPWVVNYYGGTTRPTSAASAGKNMGWTDWTLGK